MRRIVRVLVLGLIGLALGAGAATPVAAGVIDHGAIARCRYMVTASYQGTWTEALLNKIAVAPPTVAKKTGTNSVGWRFVVERSLDRGTTPWVITYRSPIQRAAKSADFTPMRVWVSVPPEDQTPNGRDHVFYRVTLKMFRYLADGSVQTKVSHLMYDMYVTVAGEEWTDSICQGVVLQYVD